MFEAISLPGQGAAPGCQVGANRVLERVAVAARTCQAACQPEQSGPAIVALEQAQPAIEGKTGREAAQRITLAISFLLARLGNLAEVNGLAAAVLGTLASAVHHQRRRSRYQGDGEESHPTHAYERAVPALPAAEPPAR